MSTQRWRAVGRTEELKTQEFRELDIDGTRITLTWRDGRFGAISAECLHVGGPLARGHIQDDYVVCPWHGWMFHRLTGKARPGIPAAVSCYELKEENGELFVNTAALTHAQHADHPPHPLAREIVRGAGPLRVAGISTTAMSSALPRFSTSEFLLGEGLKHAAARGAETRLIKLRDLAFKPCEGYYSKAARACTWPCTLSAFDPEDGLEPVYEALVHWADVVIIATPIRWGNAGSLYYRMAERMNCIQNQITVGNRVLIRDKVAGFIITGGQDNVQGVAGQLLTFFSELGFRFPQFPFVGHSRGWAAEDMEANEAVVRESAELRQQVADLLDRALDAARALTRPGPAPA